MDETLRIKIEANTNNAQANIKKTAEALAEFSEKTKFVTTEIKKMITDFRQLGNSLKVFNNLAKDLDKCATAINNVAKATTNYYNTQNKSIQLTEREVLSEQKKLQAIQKTKQEVLKTIKAENQAEASKKRLELQTARTAAGLDKLSKQTQKTTNIFNSFKLSMNVAIGNLTSGLISSAQRAMLDFASSISKAGIELDALRNTFMAATGGWQQGGQEMQWLIDMSNKLGLGFGGVSDSYAKFMTSFTRSGGTIEQSRQIFEDISAAMVNLHLPAERMQGVFVALEQMANKGTVQAEELKRQLGNALPAAFEIGAESMGILPAKLMDMMKKGEVFSKDFLPNFAKSVKQNLGQGIDIATNQFNASLGRLNTAVSLLKMELGQGVNEALKPLVDMSVPLVKALADMAKFFNENAAASAILKGALVGLAAAAFPALIGLVSQLKVALVALLPELAAVNISLGGLPLIIGGAVTALSALGFTIADTTKKASDLTPYMGMREQIVELTKSVTELDATTEEGAKQLEEYKKQFPTLTQYLIENNKTLNQLTQSEFEQIKALGIADKQTQIVIEAEKQLNSWQLKTAATFRVVWRNIAETVKSACSSMIDDWNRWRTTINQKRISDLQELIKQEQDVIKKYEGADGSALGNKDSLKYQVYSANKAALKQHQEELEKLKGINKEKEEAVKLNDKLGKSGLAGEVEVEMRAMLGIQDKLDKVYESSKTTTLGLKNAQAAYVGMSKKDKKDEKYKRQLSAEQKELRALNDERSKLAAKILTDKATPEEEKRYIALTNSMKDAKSALKELTMSEADIFSLKQQRLGQLEKEIKLGLYQNQDVTNLVNKYNEESRALKSVNDRFDELTDNAGKQKSAYEKLNDELEKTRDLYKSMLVESAGKDELESVRKRLSALEKEEAYLKRLQDREGVWKISSRAAKEFGDTIVDSIFTPLRDGENLWDRFKQAGIDALKAIAQEWAKDFLQNLVTGFSAGFSGSAIGGGGFLSNLISGIQNAVNLVEGKPLSIGANVSTTSVGGEDETSAILDNLTFSTQNFGSVLNEDVLPNALSFSSLLNEGVSTGALSSATNLLGVADSAMSAGSSLLGAANPALATAQSMATIATCAPIAAMGMGMMSATMTVASAAFQKSAPALVTMAGAMTTLAAEAATAAEAMTKLAVATATESVAKIPFVGGFLAPVAAMLTGAGIAAGMAVAGAGIGMGSSIAGAGQMFGGGMAGIGNKLSGVGGASKIIPHAKGGIVSSPTMFPMQGGNIGLAGEAGSEAIAPVRRMSNGDLGVGAVQPKITVNNYSNAAVEVIRRPDNEMEIKIKELNAMLSSSRSNKGMSNAQQRMQKSGRQIG